MEPFLTDQLRPRGIHREYFYKAGNHRRFSFVYIDEAAEEGGLMKETGGKTL